MVKSRLITFGEIGIVRYHGEGHELVENLRREFRVFQSLEPDSDSEFPAYLVATYPASFTTPEDAMMHVTLTLEP